jgi:hypothetical protein
MSGDEYARFTLLVACLACNREVGEEACQTCSRGEVVEYAASGRKSPELRPVNPELSCGRGSARCIT